MNQALLNIVSRKDLKDRPVLKVGQTVKVHQKIKEGDKERIQIFQGLILKINGQKGINQTITVRAVLSGVGCEKIFPIHSDLIEKIEVVKLSKTRRAKLYYMRERSGKSARLKEIKLAPEVLNKEIKASEIHKDIEADYQKSIAPKEETNKEEATSTPESNEEKSE